MDIVSGLISAVIMIAGVFIAIALVSAMFMIVFTIATSMDKKMQD